MLIDERIFSGAEGQAHFNSPSNNTRYYRGSSPEMVVKKLSEDGKVNVSMKVISLV